MRTWKRLSGATILRQTSSTSGRPLNLRQRPTRTRSARAGEPYIIHPLAVAQIVAEELRLDSESIEAAPAPRRHRGHRRHPRTGIQTLFTHHRRPGGRRQQADPHPVRHQGRRADGEPAEDAHRHEQGHPGDPHQDLRPAPQHADHGVPVSRQAEAEVSGDYGDLRPPSPTGWVCSASSGSWRTCP